MLRLDGIRTFVAVIESGGISAAGRRLSVSKSVVSQRLANLEDALGTRLVQRSTRNMGLTDAGTEFYERCVRILEDLDEATDAIAARRGELCGPLRFAAPMSFGILHLGPALYSFLERNPRVELKLDLNDRMVDLVGEGYDMAIRIGRLPDSSLVTRKLAVSQRVVVCSPDYAAANGLPSTLDELRDHACICYTNVEPFDEWRFQTAGRGMTVKLRSRVQVNNGDIQRDAAIAGLGIAILPTFLVSDAVKQGRLVVASLGADALPDVIHAVYPQNRHLSAKVRTLTDHLRQAFGDPPYWDAPVLRGDRPQRPETG